MGWSQTMKTFGDPDLEDIGRILKRPVLNPKELDGDKGQQKLEKPKNFMLKFRTL